MKLLVRADASRNMGTGHIMRCIALAEAWSANKRALANVDSSGGCRTESDVVFAVATITASLRKRLRETGYAVRRIRAKAGSKDDAEQTAELANKLATPLVVVDGYQFGSHFQKLLKRKGLLVLFLDDYGHATYYTADLVLNQNSYATEALYPSRAENTTLLLGTRYVLLRNEFRRRTPKPRPIRNRADRVLVTLGGAARSRQLAKLVRALGLVSPHRIRARIVIANRRSSSEIMDAVQSVTTPDKPVVHDVQILEAPCHMRANMEWADLAVSGAGSTLWELAFLGVPTLGTVLAANQRRIASDLHSRGAIRNLGGLTRLSPEKLAREVSRLLENATERAAMISAMSDLIDGAGAFRVVAEASKLIAAREGSTLKQYNNDPLAGINIFARRRKT